MMMVFGDGQNYMVLGRDFIPDVIYAPNAEHDDRCWSLGLIARSLGRDVNEWGGDYLWHCHHECPVGKTALRRKH